MCRSILIQSSSSLVLVLMLLLQVYREPLILHSARNLFCRDFDFDYDYEHEQEEYTGTCQLLPYAEVCSLSTLGWWNGRHVRLRGVCRKACGFKSRPEHQTARSTCSLASQLFDLAFVG